MAGGYSQIEATVDISRQDAFFDDPDRPQSFQASRPQLLLVSFRVAVKSTPVFDAMSGCHRLCVPRDWRGKDLL
jgi:hypothetical protein